MSVKTNATIKGFRVAFYYGINVMTRPKYLLHALCCSGAGEWIPWSAESCLALVSHKLRGWNFYLYLWPQLERRNDMTEILNYSLLGL